MFNPPAFEGAPSPASTDWNHKNCLRLHRAAICGDWDQAKRIFENDPHAMKVGLDVFKSTALHVAINGVDENAIEFVKKLVEFLSDEDIAQVTLRGDTALSIAAAAGNREAATVLVKRMPSLLYISNCDGDFPVHIAAKHGQKLMLGDLISLTKESYNGQKPYFDMTGLRLLLYVIDAEFFDVALGLVDMYPYLAKLKLADNTSALKKLAEKKSTFLHDFMNSREDLILHYIKIFWMVNTATHQSQTSNPAGDIESVTNKAGQASGGFQNLPVWVWKFIEVLAPNTTKIMKEKIVAAIEATEVVERLCDEIRSLSSEEAFNIYSHAIFIAAQHGITEVVEVIADRFPSAIYTSVNGQFIFHVAIRNRSAIDLICEKSYHKHYLHSDLVDSDGNNILHLAAKLAPPHKLNESYGAVFLMQSELQWYKKVENLVPPNCKQQLNKEGKTPMMVFTEEHNNLKEEAQRWMKDAANSCTIIATLIATVMFAAAITIPGGNNSNNNGFPIFSKEPAFVVFAISDVISLCTSVTCLSMFLTLSISSHPLTNFWYTLPKILQSGLITLQISIAFMLISFSAAVCLVFGKTKAWVLFLTTGMAYLIVLVFWWALLLPLLFPLVLSNLQVKRFLSKSNSK